MPVDGQQKNAKVYTISLKSMLTPPSSKILLPPRKLEIGTTVHVALGMQLTTQCFWTAEEDSRLGRRMNLADTSKDGVPVRATEIGGRPQTGDDVCFAVGVVDHDVRGVVGFDASGEVLRYHLSCLKKYARREQKGVRTYGMNLNIAVDILGFNSHEKRPKPFKRAIVTTNPEEVDFAQARPSTPGIIHAVPNALEDRCEWRDTDPCSNENGHLVLGHVF